MDPGRRPSQSGTTGLELTPSYAFCLPTSFKKHHDQNRHHHRERPRPDGLRAAPLDPDTGEVIGTTVAEQTTQTLRNVTAVLKAGGAGLEDVVMLRVYLTGPAHLAEMNQAYAAAVGEPFPARTTVYMQLPPGLLVEVDAPAVLGD